MENTIQNVFNLCGNRIHIENEIYGCGNKDKNGIYTIDHIKIRDRHHASLVLTSQDPCAQPFYCIVTADELKTLANVGKIIRGNDEIYVSNN